MHPCTPHLIYAIGSNVIKADVSTGCQTFLIGHGNNVTSLDLDCAGRYIASGSMNFMGFKATTFIWDFYSGCRLGEHSCHSTRVNAVKFSHDAKYLLSVGNMDDGNVVVYDVELKKVVCGLQACRGRNGFPRTVACTNTRNDCWVIGGDDYLSVWVLDKKQNRIRSEKANLKKIKRDVTSVCIDETDTFAFCGTTTGDILKIKLNLPPADGYTCDRQDPLGPGSTGPLMNGIITRLPNKCEMKTRNSHLYKGGVSALKMLDKDTFLIGGGNGIVTEGVVKMVCRPNGFPDFVMQERGPRMCARGTVTTLLVKDQDLLVGSTMNEIYSTRLGCLDKPRMLCSSHYGIVHDVAFPKCFSDVFATCSHEDVRIWNSKAMRELVRINVANMTCYAICFTNDGTSIITGWNDSNVRTYTPQTGSPLWLINHAHQRGVTGVVTTPDDRFLVTGGEEGQVRIWSLCPYQLTPIAIMKEHIGPVTGLRMKSDGEQVASSSGDGSVIIWCMKKYIRLALILQDTLFLDVAWHPSTCQLLAVSHNHKLCYFEAFDGSTIREVVASETDPVQAVDVSPCGLYVVTGGQDRLVKLWSYNEAKLLRKGCLHSAEITRVKFSPLSDYIISTCQDGSIFKWEFPKDLANVSVSICPGKCHGQLDLQVPITDGGRENIAKACDSCPCGD